MTVHKYLYYYTILRYAVHLIENDFLKNHQYILES